MPNRFLIGIDAGGTKTLATAYTSAGEKIAQVRGAAGNITANFDDSAAAIGDTAAALLSRLESEHPALTVPLLCVGAAGASAKGEALRAALRQRFDGRIDHICVISDAELALWAAHGGEDGILIVAGTGSIGYRRAGRTLWRCGGRGHLLGDEGSGYDIAIQALRAILQDEDTGETRAATLRKALLSRLGMDSTPQLMSYIYSHPKGDIAALCLTVARCAEEGDPLSQQILQRAGEQLGAMVATLLSRQPTATPLPVAILGGVFWSEGIRKR